MKTTSCRTIGRQVWLLLGLAALLVIGPVVAAQAVLLTAGTDGEVQGNLCAGTGGCAAGEAYGEAVMKLKDINNRLLFDDTSADPGPNVHNDWQITINDSTLIADGGVSHFSIEDITGATIPFRIRGGAPTDSLFVSNTGQLGLGTNAPAAPLHVARTDGSARALVREESATVARRNLLQLENSGAPFMSFTNANTTDTWQLGMRGSAFNISNPNVNLRILNSGTVRIVRAGSTTFSLRGIGNLTIGGTLTQNSDVNSKHKISPVSGDNVLAQLRELPIATWTYKNDESGATHLGPMAQDFHKAFGLGEDNRHVAPLDVAGVALAAVKELEAKVQAKDAQLAERDAQIADLEKRLSLLEGKLQNLTQVRAPGETLAALAVGR
jgi:hypothetical protein